jgi:SCP-2 sterol transfer family
VITVDSMIVALRSTFRPESAKGMRATYELRLGDIVLHARVRNGELAVSEGALPGADLVIEAGSGVRALMAGEVTPEEAIKTGAVRITGDPGLLTRFARIFRIEPMPAARY